MSLLTVLCRSNFDRFVSIKDVLNVLMFWPLSLQALALGQDILLQRGPLGVEGSGYNTDVNAEPEL